MHNEFEINRTKIKGSCQSGKKVVPRDSKSDLPLVLSPKMMTCNKQAMAFWILSADSASDIITVSFSGLQLLIARVTTDYRTRSIINRSF